MKLRLLELKLVVRSLLLSEGVKDDLKKKYPNIDVEAIFDRLGPKKQKYAQWVVRMMTERQEILDEILQMVDAFEKAKPRLANKDLNSYGTLADLRDALEAADSERAGNKLKRVADVDPSSFDILLKNKDVIVFHPKTKEASCALGKGSKWCIAASNHNQFPYYSSNNIVFYFVEVLSRSSGDPLHKIAIVVPRKENSRPEWSLVHAFNALDEHMDIEEAISSIPDGDKIVRACLADAKKRPVPGEFLAAKSKDPEKLLQLARAGIGRELMAHRQDLPEEVEKELIKHDDSFSIILKRMRQVPDFIVQDIIQNRPAMVPALFRSKAVLSSETIEELLTRPNPSYVDAMYQKNCPAWVSEKAIQNSSDEELLEMIQDEFPITEASIKYLIRRRMIKSLRQLFVFGYEPYDDEKRLSEETLRDCLALGDPEIRYGIARSQTITPELALELARAGDSNALNGLADNEKTWTPEIVRLLLQRGDGPEGAHGSIALRMAYTACYPGRSDVIRMVWPLLSREEKENIRQMGDGQIDFKGLSA